MPDEQLHSQYEGCVIMSKQGGHIWNSRCTWSPHLIKFTITHSWSPRSICFLHRPHRAVSGGVLGLTTPPPSSPRWWCQALICPGTWQLLLVYRFLGRGSFRGFHLINDKCPHSAGWGSSVGNLPVAQCLSSSDAFCSCGNNHVMGSVTP